MTTDPMETETGDRARERRRYLIGGVLALGLTLASFATVYFSGAVPGGPWPAISALAVAQIIVHFRYFLHIDLQKSHRDDLHLILFTTLIVLLMVGGTIWILFNQHSRMI